MFTMKSAFWKKWAYSFITLNQQFMQNSILQEANVVSWNNMSSIPKKFSFWSFVDCHHEKSIFTTGTLHWTIAYLRNQYQELFYLEMPWWHQIPKLRLIWKIVNDLKVMQIKCQWSRPSKFWSIFLVEKPVSFGLLACGK